MTETLYQVTLVIVIAATVHHIYVNHKLSKLITEFKRDKEALVKE